MVFVGLAVLVGTLGNALRDDISGAARVGMSWASMVLTAIALALVVSDYRRFRRGNKRNVAGAVRVLLHPEQRERLLQDKLSRVLAEREAPRAADR